MKDVIWLIQNTLRVTFKNKKNILLYLCTPLIGIVIAFISYGNVGQTTLHVGIVNNDASVITTDTIQFMKGLKNVQITTIKDSEVDQKITSGKLDSVIAFDAGFSQSVLAGNPGHIRMVSIKGTEITSFIKSYLYQYIDNISALSNTAKGDKSTFDRMYDNYQHSSFKLTTNTVKDTSKNKDMSNQTIGFLIMIMLFSAGNFSEIIIKEKENRTYFRLLSTPIDAKKYVCSNMIVTMIVMAVQIIITLVFMKGVFHIETNTPFWQMAAVLMMFALVAIGLTFMIVSFASSSTSAGAIQNLIITPSCLLAGCFWPVEIMPKEIRKIADFLPQRWTLDTLAKLQQGQHFGDLYLNIMILCAFAIAFFLIAVYKFGRNNSVRTFV